MTRSATRRAQRGMSLLESLISVLIFSIGILAIVALQAASIKATSEAKLRADASFLANQVVGRMWVANRTDAADPNFLGTYSHNAAGPACAPAGAPSPNPRVADWLASVANTLPGAAANRQMIAVGANNVVTVTLCWQVGDDLRQFVLQTQING
jgi:type IV pilus assembly protein PilV